MSYFFFKSNWKCVLKILNELHSKHLYNNFSEDTFITKDQNSLELLDLQALSVWCGGDRNGGSSSVFIVQGSGSEQGLCSHSDSYPIKWGYCAVPAAWGGWRSQWNGVGKAFRN